MEIIEEPGEMQERALGWRREGLEVGLVPTMGALHAGHRALVQRARRENAIVVASIFVNPTQFAPHEDLDRYPRPAAADRQALQEEGVDVLFAPSAQGMYGPGGAQEWGRTAHAYVDVARLGEMWEGAVRPGHLRGVATVVAKLLCLALPARAYFGEKDFQQLRVVERAAADLFLPTRIVAVPTVREPDGLALSSRNTYLSPPERAAAAVLFRALQEGARRASGGQRDVAALGLAMQAIIESEPLVTLQYLTIVHPVTLEPLQVLEAPGKARALIAARAGETRLIDNAPV
jgi:pantoate--beta-alanine ligase